MNDDRLLLEMRRWLQEERVTLPDAEQASQQIASQLPATRQRRRRWWRLPFRARMPKPLRTTNTTEYRPIPSANGHTPTVTGRTQSMFSPTKAVAAGAIVFAIGGAFLIAQPFDQQGSSVPEAEVQPPPAPTAFTSTYIWSGRSNAGSNTESDDGTIVSEGEGWLFNSGESSDPRFAGPLVLTYTAIEYPDLGGSMSVGGYRIETDEGAWQQVPTGSVSFEEDAALWASGALPPADNIQFWTFIGEGEYEGLTAVVQETWWPGGTGGLVQFDGYIFEGGLWDAPEPWVP